jgi:hypothetical protein
MGIDDFNPIQEIIGRILESYRIQEEEEKLKEID